MYHLGGVIVLDRYNRVSSMKLTVCWTAYEYLKKDNTLWLRVKKNCRCWCVSRFSRNSEAIALEFQENLKYMCSSYGVILLYNGYDEINSDNSCFIVQFLEYSRSNTEDENWTTSLDWKDNRVEFFYNECQFVLKFSLWFLKMGSVCST